MIAFNYRFLHELLQATGTGVQSGDLLDQFSITLTFTVFDHLCPDKHPPVIDIRFDTV